MQMARRHSLWVSCKYYIALMVAATLVGCSDSRGTYADAPECLAVVDGGLQRVYGVRPPAGEIGVELRGNFFHLPNGRIVAEEINYYRTLDRDAVSAEPDAWSVCTEELSSRHCEELQHWAPGEILILGSDRVRISRPSAQEFTAHDRAVWAGVSLVNRVCQG